MTGRTISVTVTSVEMTMDEVRASLVPYTTYNFPSPLTTTSSTPSPSTSWKVDKAELGPEARPMILKPPGPDEKEAKLTNPYARARVRKITNISPASLENMMSGTPSSFMSPAPLATKPKLCSLPAPR